MKVSAKLKEKMLKSKDFSRPVVARNYDSISFNYKGTGRWQLRFLPDHADYQGEKKVDVFINGRGIDMFRTNRKVPTLTEIKEALEPYENLRPGEI